MDEDCEVSDHEDEPNDEIINSFANEQNEGTNASTTIHSLSLPDTLIMKKPGKNRAMQHQLKELIYHEELSEVESDSEFSEQEAQLINHEEKASTKNPKRKTSSSSLSDK